MEMLLCTTEEETVPSKKAFKDDVTVISETKARMGKLLKRLQELFKWAVMKIKPSKSFCLFIIKERRQEIKFVLDNNVIITICEVLLVRKHLRPLYSRL